MTTHLMHNQESEKAHSMYNLRNTHFIHQQSSKRIIIIQMKEHTLYNINITEEYHTLVKNTFCIAKHMKGHTLYINILANEHFVHNQSSEIIHFI